MSIANAVKDRMLAVFAGESLMVGLFDGGREVEDVRYERQPVEFSSPQGDETRFVENVVELRFQDMGKDHRVTAFGLFDASGELRATFPLLKPRDMPADDNPIFRPGKLSIGLPWWPRPADSLRALIAAFAP